MDSFRFLKSMRSKHGRATPAPVLRGRKDGRRGSFLVEFALAVWILVMLSGGVFAAGINLDRYLAVLHLSQFAADTYRSNAQLDVSAVRQVLLKGSTGLAITQAGGQGVVYLSKVSLATAGTNVGSAVITHRLAIGNSGLGASRLGTPSSIDSHGHVSNFETDAAARATLPAGMTLTAGQTLYVAEVTESGAETAFTGWMSVPRMRAIHYY